MRTTIILAVLSLFSASEESCEIFKKTVTIFRTERLLYKYLACTNITSNYDLRSEILSKVNSSNLYLQVTNSSIPSVNRTIFSKLNLTQLKIEADVVSILEKAFQAANISTIILENNRIKTIGDGGFNSTSIYVLSLQNNSLDEITQFQYAGLVNLRKLYLENNRISRIHQEAFTDLISVDELNLSFNAIFALPSQLLYPLKNLQTLFLNNNWLKYLQSDIISHNSILQYISLQNNELTELNTTLYPQSVVYINAENNHIRFVNFSHLINLNKLILNNNNLTTISNSFNNLPGLSYLHLNKNFLGTSILKESFMHLKNLTIIEIDNNYLKEFDFKMLQGLSLLNGISLAENQIRRLNFTNVSLSIKQVNLSSNSLNSLINVGMLRNLLKLDLSINNFQRITFDMFEGARTLQNLWLQQNSIKYIELGSFRDLKSLLDLNLSHNKIIGIIPGIFNGLNLLGQLDLSYNSITNFDEDVFHNMKTLRFLNIAFNNLTNVNVKRILSHTVWLREINLNGNNWTCKSLVNIVRDNKIIVLTPGNFYNVSNVYGVPCNDSDEDPHFNKATYLPDILKLMNMTTSDTKNISHKMNISNTILVLFLILVCSKCIYEKYSSHLTVARQFMYQKKANEQEISLI